MLSPSIVLTICSLALETRLPPALEIAPESASQPIVKKAQKILSPVPVAITSAG